MFKNDYESTSSECLVSFISNDIFAKDILQFNCYFIKTEILFLFQHFYAVSDLLIDLGGRVVEGDQFLVLSIFYARVLAV